MKKKQGMSVLHLFFKLLHIHLNLNQKNKFMPTGIIASVETKVDPPVSGTIKADETGDLIPFTDPNFAKLGLTVGDPVAYTLDPNSKELIAINLAVVAPPLKEIEITGPSAGFKINANETYILKGAAAVVTGDIDITSGKLIAGKDSSVKGNITGNDATIVARNKGSLNGNITITDGALKVVTGGCVTGNVVITNRARIIIGNDEGPGKITGTLSVQHATLLTITKDSKINCGV
jgi:hypothetical protein